MKCHRFRRIALRLTLGAVLIPALLWIAIVLVAPTRWARTYVVSALENGSGRVVQLDELCLCLGGGVSLSNLRISAPQGKGDPWLHAERIDIDVSPIQLLFGRFEPTRVDVLGGSLRVYRRADGTLELSDLVQSNSAGKPKHQVTSAEPHQCGSCALTARLQRINIVVVDERTGTLMNFKEVHGEGVVEADGALMVSLAGQWNEGPFQFTAHLERGMAQPSFDGQLMANDVIMDQGMSAIRFAVPVLAGSPAELKGRLGINVYLGGRGQTRDEICRSLSGRGTVSLDPIALGGTPLVAEFARLAGRPAEEVVGSIKTDFVVRNNRILTENLSMDLGRVPVNVTGWTDFGGHLDYQVRLDNLASRIPEKAREYLSRLDLDVDGLTSLRLTGTVEEVAIRPLGTGPDGRVPVERVIGPEDRQRLKMLGRQIRD